MDSFDPLSSADPMGGKTIPELVEAFRAEYDGYLSEGCVLYLPDKGQSFEIVGVTFRAVKGKMGGRRVILVWESDCVICGSRYSFMTRRKFKYPTRTCEEHRGQIVSPTRPKRDPADAAPSLPRYGKIERAVLAAVEQADRFSFPLAELVEQVAQALPAPQDGKRDSRKFRAARAVQSVAEADGSPIAVRGDSVLLL